MLTVQDWIDAGYEDEGNWYLKPHEECIVWKGNE